jgi:hypothetical protein
MWTATKFKAFFFGKKSMPTLWKVGRVTLKKRLIICMQRIRDYRTEVHKVRDSQMKSKFDLKQRY